MTSQMVEAEPATIADLLDMGVRLESRVQGIYGAFARMFACNPEVAKLWHGMAADEALHRDLLNRVRAGMKARRLSQPADARMVERARELLSVDIETRLDEVHNLDDAYEVANDLECSETNTIFRFFVTELSLHAQVIAALMQDLDEHIERLTTGLPAEYATRTSRAELKAIRP